ncbi:hypothetical protein PanWU01x14_165010, partial [Parasponia andersonii]
GLGKAFLATKEEDLWKLVVLAGLWALWLEMNHRIFEGVEEGVEVGEGQILGSYLATRFKGIQELYFF